MNALEVVDLRVRFGGLVALDGVNVNVAEGEVLGLIGPNGAGKTTLIDAVTGVEPYEGTVRVLGQPFDRLRPDERARLGLARTFQSLELFDDLTVGENIAVSGRINRVTNEDRERVLEQIGLTSLIDERAADLDFATRKFVALARAFAARPRVLLVDEVAAGLDRDARDRVGRHLREAATTRTGVVLVDHDLELVLEVSDRVVVLDHGVVIADGPPENVRRDATVIAAYLGRAR